MKQFKGNLKYKKPFRFKFKNYNKTERYFFKPLYGLLGIQAIDAGFLTFKEIEAGRIVIRRYLRKYDKIINRRILFDYKYKLKINIFYYYPITKKAIGVRMGKGKGSIDSWNCVIRKGSLLYELRVLYNDKFLIKSLKKCQERLSLKTRIVSILY